MAIKNSSSKLRIAEMMEVLGIKQADIVKRTGIPKSTLSNYLSGKRVPTQPQLSVLADPYGINPAWLMGYDVPMYLKDTPKSFDTPEEFEREWQAAGGAPHPDFTVPWTDHGAKNTPPLTDDEMELIIEYRNASEDKRKEAKRLLMYAALMGGDNHANR